MNQQTSIYILFEDEDIRLIFSELIEALGKKTEIIESSSGLPEYASIVTEPRYYQELLPGQKIRSLVVGSKTALEKISTPSLSRPLTEEKIETALATLLQNSEAR